VENGFGSGPYAGKEQYFCVSAAAFVEHTPDTVSGVIASQQYPAAILTGVIRFIVLQPVPPLAEFVSPSRTLGDPALSEYTPALMLQDTPA
jgi:hypothetical protein